jgi:16S rRNA (guanine966-N2)-methyltransferase
VVTGSVNDFLIRSRGEFDLVFIDPPWSLESVALEQRLAELDSMLRPQGEVIMSRRHGDDLPAAPENWRVATDRSYGDTRIVVYEKEADGQ